MIPVRRGSSNMLSPARCWHALGEQLRRPAGLAGRLLGHAMGLVNARPNDLAIEALLLQPDHDVLELGFGPGLAIRQMTWQVPRGRIIGIDHSPQMLRQAAWRNRSAIRRGQVMLRLASFDDTGLPDACVDRVLAVNVAYFFHADAREVREVHRLLRPGGRFVLYVTHAQSMAGWPFARGGSHRLLDEDGLRALLEQGGFGSGQVVIQHAEIARGIIGLLAVAERQGAGMKAPAVSRPRGIACAEKHGVEREQSGLTSGRDWH